jgi:hypothetical protein
MDPPGIVLGTADLIACQIRLTASIGSLNRLLRSHAHSRLTVRFPNSGRRGRNRMGHA